MALEEFGLDDRVTLRPDGMTWHQRGGLPIEVDVDLCIERRATMRSKVGSAKDDACVLRDAAQAPQARRAGPAAVPRGCA